MTDSVDVGIVSTRGARNLSEAPAFVRKESPLARGRTAIPAPIRRLIRLRKCIANDMPRDGRFSAASQRAEFASRSFDAPHTHYLADVTNFLLVSLTIVEIRNVISPCWAKAILQVPFFAVSIGNATIVSVAKFGLFEAYMTFGAKRDQYRKGPP